MRKQELISRLKEYEIVFKDIITQTQKLVSAKPWVKGTRGEIVANDLILNINSLRQKNQAYIRQISAADDAAAESVAQRILDLMEEKLSSFQRLLKNLPNYFHTW